MHSQGWHLLARKMTETLRNGSSALCSLFTQSADERAIRSLETGDNTWG